VNLEQLGDPRDAKLTCLQLASALAQSFGPQEAHRIMFSEDPPGCWNMEMKGGAPAAP
jgi:hypothetical protein